MNETIFLGECPIIRPEGIYFGGRRVIRLGMGDLERHNPLPAGRYWVDVFAPDASAFIAWLRANKNAVHVTTTESFPENGGGPARDWYLFDVTTPVPWSGPGFPTVAGPEIKTAEDTAQRPDPEKDPTDKLDDWIKNDMSAVLSTIKVAVIGAAVVGTIVLGVSLLKDRPDPAPRRERFPAS